MTKILSARVALAMVILTAGAAHAQMTTCYGTDNCTVVTPQGSRTMSLGEARNSARANARNELDRVTWNCPIAADPARCQELVRELREQFRPR